MVIGLQSRILLHLCLHAEVLYASPTQWLHLIPQNYANHQQDYLRPAFMSMFVETKLTK